MQPEIVDALPHAVVAIGPDDAVVWCNRAFRVAFALGDSPLSGARLFSLCDWYFDDPEVHEALSAVRDGLPEAGCTLSRNGGRVYEVAVRALEGAGDGAALLVFSDISEQVRSDAAGSRSRAQLEIVNAIIRAATSCMTTTAILEAVLERTLALLGFDAGAVYLVGEDPAVAHLRVAQGFYELVYAGAPTIRLDCPPHDALADGGTCYRETYLDIAHEEGELGVFSAASIPISADGRVIGLLAIVSSSFYRFSPLEREVLEAIGAELGAVVRRGELEAALAREHRAAELYLDVITHDLGNLQTAALANAEALEEALSPEERPRLGQIRETLRRGLSVVRNIGTLRRLRDDAGSLVPTRLVTAVEAARADAGSMAVEVAGDGIVLADPLLVEVFANLFGNSNKFGATTVRVVVEEAGDRIVVRVEDDGPGIPEKEKARVFSRYVTGPTPGSGSGLGLSIVAALMDRYGGAADVRDRVPGRHGAGAAFILSFRRPT